MLRISPFVNIGLCCTSVTTRFVLIEAFQIAIKLLDQFSKRYCHTLRHLKLIVEKSNDKSCMLSFQQFDTGRMLEIPGQPIFVQTKGHDMLLLLLYDLIYFFSPAA